MSSNNGKRRKPFFISRWRTGAFIVALTLLTAGFLLISPNTVVTATPSNTTTITTLSSPSLPQIELSSQPIYQEHVRDVNETLINQTHAQLVVEGN
jgi:hypothetical protein